MAAATSPATPAASPATSGSNRGRRLSKVHRATEWLKPSFARSSATMSASVRDQMPKPSCVSCQLGSPTTTRFTRTRLSDIVHPVSSSQLTQDPDRVRSFGGYNTRGLGSCQRSGYRGIELPVIDVAGIQVVLGCNRTSVGVADRDASADIELTCAVEVAKIVLNKAARRKAAVVAEEDARGWFARPVAPRRGVNGIAIYLHEGGADCDLSPTAGDQIIVFANVVAKYIGARIREIQQARPSIVVPVIILDNRVGHPTIEIKAYPVTACRKIHWHNVVGFIESDCD